MGKYVWTIFFIPFLLFGTVKHSSFVDHDTTSCPIQANASSPPFKGLILVGNNADLNPAGYHDVHGVMSYLVELPGATGPAAARVPGDPEPDPIGLDVSVARPDSSRLRRGRPLQRTPRNSPLADPASPARWPD